MLDCALQILFVEIAPCVANLGLSDLASLLLGQAAPQHTALTFIFRDRVPDDGDGRVGSLRFAGHGDGLRGTVWNALAHVILPVAGKTAVDLRPVSQM
jgi:hypothetical protein